MKSEDEDSHSLHYNAYSVILDSAVSGVHVSHSICLSIPSNVRQAGLIFPEEFFYNYVNFEAS